MPGLLGTGREDAMSRLRDSSTTSPSDPIGFGAWSVRVLRGGTGSLRRAALTLFLILSMLAAGADGPAQARPLRAAAIVPVLQVSLTSGPAGITVALNGSGYPREADLAAATISFDGAGIGTTKITNCVQLVGLLGFGFGTNCTGTAVTISVPQGASPGAHTITVTGSDGNGGQYPASATFTVLAPPAMDLNPSSGLAGTLTSLSVTYFPGTAAQQTASIAFDGSLVGQTQVGQCTAAGQPTGSFGLGADCTGSTYLLQIPQSALPGSHSVTVTAPVLGNRAGSVSVSGTFTVTAPQATVTVTPSATATVTASVTASATTSATASATASSTVTAVPATGTATPSATATASRTATATSTAIPRPALLLVKPAFDSDSVYLVLHADPHVAVQVSLQVVTVTGGMVSPHYSLSGSGVTNARGIYSAVLHLAFHQHIQGRADLIVTTTRAGRMVKASRIFGYSVNT